MKNIKVTLLHHTPLYIASDGARTCWASQDKSDTAEVLTEAVKQYGDSSDSIYWQDAELILKPITIGPKDLALIDRVGNQFHHASILEHITFNFFFWCQSCYRVNHNDIHCGRTDKLIGNFKRLLTIIRL